MWQVTLRVKRPGRVLALVVGLVLLAMSPSAALAAGRRLEVYMGDDYYQPDVVHVEAGDTIVFVNKGKQMHSPTLIDHEDVLDQEFVKPGQTFSLVVPAALALGEYPLGCNIHIDMKAKIVVQAGTPQGERH